VSAALTTLASRIASLPKLQIGSIKGTERTVLALLPNEFSQVAYVDIDRGDDLENSGIALDKTPKHMNCVINHSV
jgi:hypothetical protein